MEFVRLDSGLLAAKCIYYFNFRCFSNLFLVMESCDYSYVCLLNFSDPLWKVSRKHINLAFNLNVLKGYIPLFLEKSEKTVLEMEQHLDGKEFNVLVDIARLSSAAVAGKLFLSEIFDLLGKIISSFRCIVLVFLTLTWSLNIYFKNCND